jgi:hypothetical protein
MKSPAAEPARGDGAALRGAAAARGRGCIAGPAAPSHAGAAPAAAAAAALMLVLLAAAAAPRVGAQICSVTIQYGASIGDTLRNVSSKELPIFVGSFSMLSLDNQVRSRGAGTDTPIKVLPTSKCSARPCNARAVPHCNCAPAA